MKYVAAFRDGALAMGLAQALGREVEPHRSYAFMEFCGGHTHAISRHGVLDLLPSNVRMIHGPGCPVCVLPIGRLDMVIQLALARPEVMVCTYGDCLRVPASGGLSLLKARARGADVRMIYSAADALALARQHPDREVVFFAIGFETTTPPTALVIRQARAEALGNFSVLCNHVLTPPAMRAILAAGEANLDGVVGPAHVSTVIGSQPYEFCATEFGKPVVIAGFEPVDVIQAIRMLVRQVNESQARVENEFTRAVTPTGNAKAQALMAEVFARRPSFEWRGLGTIPYSALAICPDFAPWDTEAKFQLSAQAVADHKACECGAILRGVKAPRECRIFATACTPENPVGACMVSAEGACAAYYTYGRFRDEARAAPG